MPRGRPGAGSGKSQPCPAHPSIVIRFIPLSIRSRRRRRRRHIPTSFACGGARAPTGDVIGRA